ncbi:polysaccharide deacetylase family protein [Marinobacterium arenosum]|uniref:polysaccharide deacetylase family protein n=1 Tax=Marinobacterium arenosum TaxID=2862496 RepID=UPI001C9896A1|nr:polysaccharide deacetylase family protein [Marinobacterium arenosum]MBY4676440.1 polysaccharide deacetylase family protein [Marinobacterium arenosum]
MSWLLPILLILVAVLFSQRYKWWRKAVPDSAPRLLMYHMVSEQKPGAKFNKLRVPPAMFERQVKWLADHGYYFALMSELAEPQKLPPKTVALTFDDGFEDNFRNAHPVLQRYNARATLYLVEDRFERDWSTSKKAHHDSGELMREAKLSDDQVRQMLDSGCWELGGHTRTHANLAKLDAAAKLAEIRDSKIALEAQFNTRLASFAYPFGIYDAQDVALAEQAGFANAVTTVEGIDPDPAAKPFELKRVKISGKDNWLAFRLRLRTGRRG